MLTLQDMKNLKTFLERVPMTGKEAIAWCQTVANLDAAIDVLAREEAKVAAAAAAMPKKA